MSGKTFWKTLHCKACDIPLHGLPSYMEMRFMPVRTTDYMSSMKKHNPSSTSVKTCSTLPVWPDNIVYSAYRDREGGCGSVRCTAESTIAQQHLASGSTLPGYQENSLGPARGFGN